MGDYWTSMKTVELSRQEMQIILDCMNECRPLLGNSLEVNITTMGPTAHKVFGPIEKAVYTTMHEKLDELERLYNKILEWQKP